MLTAQDFPILLGRNSEQIAVQYARGGLPPCARRRVHDYIAAHLDQKITNDALAQIAGLSTAHFCAVFKQIEGMSPHHYVLQCRVRQTQQLLAVPKCHWRKSRMPWVSPIKAIASNLSGKLSVSLPATIGAVSF